MSRTKKEWRIVMKNGRTLIGLLAIAVVVSLGALPAQAQEQEQAGVNQGNYNVKQSIELGGRFVTVSGDTQAYDTFVNLQQGPRPLGFTLEMNSLNHHGTWYDHFSFSNFGYGGDPNVVSRLRATKNAWYKFDALFRKDENLWDYSLQANPINPTAPFANGPAGYGGTICTACVLNFYPHNMNTRRKLGDYNLIIRPESSVRLRLGYSRNTVEGPAFSTIHQGTEQFLFADVKTTVNAYRAGMDFKLLPRTNISYDQIWNYYKGDTAITDFAQPFPLNPTQNVDLGVSFNATANQPCGGTFLASGFVNPACSAYFNGYLNHGRTRTNTPTEQLSVQSNYWQKLDLTARLSYSSGDTNVFGYNQTIFGRESRSNLRNQTNTGPVFGRRVATVADFGGTWHISDKLSFLDTFHYSNWHDPAAFEASSCSFFSPNLNASAFFFTPSAPVPLTCVPPADAQPATATNPVAHTSGSPADLSIILDSNFLKQEERMNLAEVDYRFSQKLGARVGMRYRHRIIADNFYETLNEVFYPGPTAALAARGTCALVNPANPVSQANLPAGCTLNSDSSISFLSVPAFVPASDVVPPINEFSGLFGIWARPRQKLQISFDTELFSADGSFTRISPRQSQEYRVRAKYVLTSWLNLDGNALIWEARNNVANVNNLQHNRTYGISAIFQPRDNIGLEIGYDYNDVFSQILICFVSSAAPTGPSTVTCPGVSGLQQQLSTYTNKSHYGYFDFSLAPAHRLTAHLGANLTGTSGSALLVITPQVPSGSLDSKWLHPFGGLDYRFSKNWTAKAYYEYYGYHEDPTANTTTGAIVAQDQFAARNFRSHLVTLSVKYAF
jgi:opacity protein-like surface antigen